MVRSVEVKERESQPPIEPITVHATVEVTPAPPMVGSSGVPLRPVTIYLPQALAERLTLHCIDQDRDASNVIGEALEHHLSRRLGAGTPPPPSARRTSEPAGARHAGPSFWNQSPESRGDAWPMNRLERLFEIGRLIRSLVRRQGYAA
jgi:hypothetical protein